jgi:hypothetical protein
MMLVIQIYDIAYRLLATGFKVLSAGFKSWVQVHCPQRVTVSLASLLSSFEVFFIGTPTRRQPTTLSPMKTVAWLDATPRPSLQV